MRVAGENEAQIGGRHAFEEAPARLHGHVADVGRRRGLRIVEEERLVQQQRQRPAARLGEAGAEPGPLLRLGAAAAGEELGVEADEAPGLGIVPIAWLLRP